MHYTQSDMRQLMEASGIANNEQRQPQHTNFMQVFILLRDYTQLKVCDVYY